MVKERMRKLSAKTTLARGRKTDRLGVAQSSHRRSASVTGTGIVVRIAISRDDMQRVIGGRQLLRSREQGGVNHKRIPRLSIARKKQIPGSIRRKTPWVNLLGRLPDMLTMVPAFGPPPAINSMVPEEGSMLTMLPSRRALPSLINSNPTYRWPWAKTIVEPNVA